MTPEQAAVIDAARKLIEKHFEVVIGANPKAAKTWLEVTMLTMSGTPMRRIKPDDTRDDLFNAAAALSAAIEALDEVEAEGETESEDAR